MLSLLSVAKKWIDRKAFSGIRISTRPDSIDEEVLSVLREYGVTSIELGAQSCNNAVLEKNRRTYSDERHLSVEMADVVKFEDNMDVFPDRYEITGLDGALNVKNISTSDISGDLYVYYKYFSQDQLYGGITFRAKIPGGVKAGEIRQISAGHFNPDNCIVLAVTTEG